MTPRHDGRQLTTGQKAAIIIGLALTAWLAVAAIATVFLALIGARP